MIKFFCYMFLIISVACGLAYLALINWQIVEFIVGVCVLFVLVFIMYISEMSHSTDYSDQFSAEYNIGNSNLYVRIVDCETEFKLYYKTNKKEKETEKTFKTINDISVFLNKTYGIELETN